MHAGPPYHGLAPLVGRMLRSRGRGCARDHELSGACREMKALFVSLYAATPHLETELELISDLLDERSEVFVLRCTGQLAACVHNPEHKQGWCKLCVSKVDAGLG